MSPRAGFQRVAGRGSAGRRKAMQVKSEHELGRDLGTESSLNHSVVLVHGPTSGPTRHESASVVCTSWTEASSP